MLYKWVCMYLHAYTHIHILFLLGENSKAIRREDTEQTPSWPCPASTVISILSRVCLANPRHCTFCSYVLHFSFQTDKAFFSEHKLHAIIIPPKLVFICNDKYPVLIQVSPFYKICRKDVFKILIGFPWEPWCTRCISLSCPFRLLLLNRSSPTSFFSFFLCHFC